MRFVHDGVSLMHLKVYLNENGISTYAFSRIIEEKTGRAFDQSVIWRWAADKQRPDWGSIPYITKATDGQVTAMDFVPEID